MYVFRYEFKGGGSVSVVVCCEQIRYRVIDARLIYFVLETDKARILLTDRFFFLEFMRFLFGSHSGGCLFCDFRSF